MATIDPILLLLVRSIDHHDGDGCDIPGIPIVLHMGGIIIMGDLISERQFVESSKTLVRNLFEKRQDLIEDIAVMSNLTLSDIKTSEPQFIHLKEVVFCVPGGPQVPPNSTEFWRGRLEGIDGFFLGDNL